MNPTVQQQAGLLKDMNWDASLEPVPRDGLRRLRAGVTFKRTFAALRSASSVAFGKLRKIFSQPSFEEIFDGHFERDADRVGVHLKPTLWNFL